MTTQKARMMSNEALRDFARFGQDLSKLTYNQQRRAGVARAELKARDYADAHA